MPQKVEMIPFISRIANFKRKEVLKKKFIMGIIKLNNLCLNLSKLKFG